MQNNNMPELHNPMMDLMVGNMPGLPNVISNAMPTTLPRMNYNDNVISMIFGTYKRRKMNEATEFEKRIAENCRDSVKAKFDTILEVVTFSARVNDSLGQYEHNKTIRLLEVQEKQADIYIKNAQAQQIGFEAKLSELDYNIKLKQYQKMMGE